jgi:hypothetical protein
MKPKLGIHSHILGVYIVMHGQSEKERCLFLFHIFLYGEEDFFLKDCPQFWFLLFLEILRKPLHVISIGTI